MQSVRTGLIHKHLAGLRVHSLHDVEHARFVHRAGVRYLARWVSRVLVAALAWPSQATKQSMPALDWSETSQAGQVTMGCGETHFAQISVFPPAAGSGGRLIGQQSVHLNGSSGMTVVTPIDPAGLASVITSTLSDKAYE